MPNLMATFILALPALLLPGVPAPSPDLLKCSPRPDSAAGMPDAVVIIEEAVVEGDQRDWATLSAEHEIETAEIVCWKWVETHYGVQVKLGATYIRTKQQVERERTDGIAALEGLVAAQDRHRERHGTYALEAQALTDFTLSGYGLPVFFEVEFDSVAEGWAARLVASTKMPGGLGFRPNACRVFVGSAPTEWRSMRRDGQPLQIKERQPVCHF